MLTLKLALYDTPQHTGLTRAIAIAPSRSAELSDARRKVVRGLAKHLETYQILHGGIEMKWLTLVLASVVLTAPITTKAAAVTYNFSWVGTGGYTMSGQFSFDSASASDGIITSSEVSSLVFGGFLNGVSIGTNNSAATLSGFNFNFNAVSGQFLLGGNSFVDGQRWNTNGSGLGFAAGNMNSLLTFDVTAYGILPNPSTLIATLASPVPEPASLTFIAIGLVALRMSMRRGTQHRR